MVSPEFALLPVYKPPGPTSTAVLNELKRHFGFKKIGHTGTLDPFAEGVLILLLGKATRLAPYYQELPKTYEAVGVLGVDTDTYDLTGRVLRTEEPPPVEEEKFKSALREFKGEIEQVPPPFSAKKIKGKRAYKLARRGKSVELKPIKVKVYSIEPLWLNPPEFAFRATVSGGTYVRTLVRDLGKKLGSIAATKRLVRTSVGSIKTEDCFTLEELLKERSPERFLKRADAGLENLKAVKLNDAQIRRLARGLPVELEAPLAGPVRILDREGNLVAMGEAKGGILKPKRVFISL